jgi:hypothetical protein
MNKLTKILVTIFTTFVVSTIQSQNVNVTCVNRTGFNLDSVLIEDVMLGQLKNDSATQVIRFKGITLDSGVMPLLSIKSNIDNRPVTQNKMHFICGSSWEQKTEGDYVLYIYITSKP